MKAGMTIKPLLGMSALTLVMGLSMTACGGGDSTASVCHKISADGKAESSALSGLSQGSNSVSQQTIRELQTFAGKIRDDVSNASSDGLKKAGEKFAGDIDKAASDAKGGRSAGLSDLSSFVNDAKALEHYCPQIGNSTS